MSFRFQVSSFGFRVWGLRFGVRGLGFVWSLEFGVWGLRFVGWVWGNEFGFRTAALATASIVSLSDPRLSALNPQLSTLHPPPETRQVLTRTLAHQPQKTRLHVQDPGLECCVRDGSRCFGVGFWGWTPALATASMVSWSDATFASLSATKTVSQSARQSRLSGSQSVRQ